MCTDTSKTPAMESAIRVKSFRPSGRFRFIADSERGWSGSISPLVAKAVTTIYRRVFFLAYPLIGSSVPQYLPTIDVEFGLLRPDDAESYRRFRRSAAAAEVARRLAWGHRCYVAWQHGEIVDACWAAAGCVEVPYLRGFLDLPEGDLYFYDSYTHPSFRGRGVYMARNAFAASECKREGLARLVALVAAEKYAVWQILTRSGLKTIGRYDLLRVGPWNWYRTLAIEGEILPRLL